MAQKSFLVPINMNGLEIQNFLVQNLGSAPTGAEGQLYYNTQDHKLYYKNNSAWVPLTANTDTHHTSKTITTNSATSTTQTASALTNGNVYLNHIENSAVRSSHKMSGSGATTVTTDTSGNIIVSSTNSTYTPASATPLMDGTGAVGTSAKYAREDHVHPSDTSRVPTTRKVNGKALSADVTLTGADINATVWDETDTVASWLSAHDQALATLDLGKINGITIKSATGTNYGTCSTAAATAEKAVSIAGYSLYSGSVVFVKFTVTNTAAVANLKLNVNSTGAKPIKYRGGNLSSVGLLAANRVYAFVYDGTNYELIGDLDTNTTYSAGTADLLTTGTDTANRVWQAKILHDYIAGAISDLPEPMVFKGTVGTNGTITSLPAAAASNEGFTYKVITAMSSPVTAKVGDTVISNGSAWTVIPSGDEPSGTVTSVGSGTGLTGGPITTSGTLSLATVHSTAPGAKGDTSNQTPGFGGTFNVTSATVDAYGRTTAFASHTVKIPNATATTSAAGLMSGTDKAKLNAISEVVTVSDFIPVGQTSVSIPYPNGHENLVSYSAYLETSKEFVEIDAKYSDGDYVFSIASAITEKVLITVLFTI